MNGVQGRALSLYRAIYRAAGKMPTKDRVSYIRQKLRHEYEYNRNETNPDKIEFLLNVAEVQLDTVKVQADHLTELFGNPDVYQ